VDKEIRNHAAGRDASAHDAGADPATPRDLPNAGTAPATRPPELTPTAAGFRIRFCGWCRQIDIRGPRRDTDVVSLLIIGKRILAAWNGKVMIVQDGICEACSENLHQRKEKL
jgi:hypothetical protein